MSARGDEGSLLDSQSATRYRILRRVGVGGMSTVFAAHDSQLGRDVALKLLKKDPLASDEGERRRLRMMREAQALKLVSHENVVRVFDVGSAGDQLFITMELIHGSALREWIKERSRGLREILDVFIAAGRGLAAAHERGLIHRDFKPGNVLVSGDGRVVVTDFGLVRFGPEVEDLKTSAGVQQTFAAVLGAPLTAPGAVIGTPGYMAPEQLQGQSTDHRTDQFSFCVALYEALYGERPFAPASDDALPPEIALALAVVQGEVRPEPDGSTVPRELRDILLRGLSVKPDDRHSSMRELLDELIAFDDRGSRAPVLIAGGAVMCLAIASAVVIAVPPSDPCATLSAVNEPGTGEVARFFEEWNVTRDVLCGPVFAKDLGARRAARACLLARQEEVAALPRSGDPAVLAVLPLALTPPARCADDPKNVGEGGGDAGASLDERAVLELIFSRLAAGDDLGRVRAHFALAARAGRASLSLSGSDLYARTGSGSRAGHELHALGHLFAALGRREDALACFEAMVLASADVAGGRAHAAMGLEASARIQLERGRALEAADLFSRAQALFGAMPNDQRLARARVGTGLAVALSRAGESARAMEAAKTAVAQIAELDPALAPDLLVSNASVLTRGGATDEARRLLAQAIAASKDPLVSARAQQALGELFLEDHQRERAIDQLSAALATAEKSATPGDPLIRDALTGLAIAELASGAVRDRVSAVQRLERALALSRAHGDSKERSARIRFTLARALIDQPEEKARSLGLARSAIDELAPSGEGTCPRCQEISRWIAAVE